MPVKGNSLPFTGFFYFMENLIEEPKIGDVIYSKSIYHGWGNCTVKRTTATQIILVNSFSNEVRIKKPFSDGCCEIGNAGYGSNSYYLKTSERSNEVLHQYILAKLRSAFNCADFKNLPVEKLKQILDLLNS